MKKEKRYEELSEKLRASFKEYCLFPRQGVPVLLVAEFDQEPISDTLDRIGLPAMIGMGSCRPLALNLSDAIKADFDQVGRVVKWNKVPPTLRPLVIQELGFEEGHFPNYLEVVMAPQATS